MVQRLKDRLLRILKEVPELRDIFLSEEDIEKKRKKIQRLLTDLLGPRPAHGARPATLEALAGEVR